MSHKATCLLIAVLVAPLGLTASARLKADTTSALAVPDQLPPVLPTKEDPRLIEVASLQRIANGVTTSPDGRIFLSHPQVEGPGAQVSELKAGQPVPYPDEGINLWKPDGDPTRTFMKVNSLRVGPDGDLWVVDAGARGVGYKATPGAAKIVRIDLRANRVRRVYQAPASAVREYSYFNDMRFSPDGRRVYISDAAGLLPAIVVLDIDTGEMRRVLENHPLTIARFKMYGDGRQLVLKDPIPAWWGGMTTDKMVNVDQLEVSPDGRWLYFHPIGGPLARVETRLVDDPRTPAATLFNSVEKLIDTWTAAGTAIDAGGNIYMSQVNTRSVMRIAPDMTVTTLVSDPRLTWVDAMWIDSAGFLYMPAAQLDKTSANFAGGPAQLRYPMKIWKMPVQQRPPAIDHR
jgi:sugar lactone lactonase YvrE